MDFSDGLNRLSAFSSYAASLATRYPDTLQRAYHHDRFQEDHFDCSSLIDVTSDRAQLLKQLRVARHLGCFRILWRDVHGMADTAQILIETSELAQQLIEHALAGASASMQRFGQPLDGAERPVDPVIFGLGKLGGRELNFSSDIDLVCAYTAAGETSGRRKLANEEYFARLVRHMVGLLGDVTEDGQCYRVDLRLRPFGNAGRVALSFNAMDQYFQRDGRDWERYAWIKARPVAGNIEAGEQWLRSLRPFIYRRYLDFGVFESLRNMQAMIRAEVARKELSEDVKLGRGGIREIEFVVQAFQMVRGGREASLRSRVLLDVLPHLERLGLLTGSERRTLGKAYLLLRTVENRFQQVADAQTHRPPADPNVCEALAQSTGFGGWEALDHALTRERAAVAKVFDHLFARDDADAGAVWSESQNAERFEQFLASTEIRTLGARTRSQLEALLGRLGQFELAATTLDAVLRLLSRVAGRSTYLALLTEHAEVLEHLVGLVRQSPWLANEMVARPMLLDDLIDRRRPDQESALADRLQSRMVSADGDLETEMDVLREVQSSRRFQIARSFLDNEIDAFQAAVLLSQLADAVLVQILHCAERDIASRYGTFEPPASMMIVAYGTLGAREMSLNSDLDLVFLHNAASSDSGRLAVSNGRRALDGTVYFSRMVQRVMLYLTTVTSLGRLYEVDTRLRPNGRSGLLVSTIDGFFAYQRKQAWTWELQALTRARALGGSESARRQFEQQRAAVIARSREPASLVKEVTDMRQKMRTEHVHDGPGFHLKHDPGGRTDLDFLLQFARLRWSADRPDLALARSNQQTIQALAASAILSSDQASALRQSDAAFRQAVLNSALHATPLVIDEVAGRKLAQPVLDLWRQWLS